jgi:hypothetical protein
MARLWGRLSVNIRVLVPESIAREETGLFVESGLQIAEDPARDAATPGECIEDCGKSR